MYMTLQFTIRLKPLSTVRTQIGSHVSVHSKFMSLQVAGNDETFVTQRTHVQLFSFSSVDSNVHVELSIRLKHLSTISTEKRSLVGVYRYFMSLQVAGETETFVTERTDI